MSDNKKNNSANSEQRRVLWIVLTLNLLLVGILAVAGASADSTALLANALDNASDCAVYALSLFAVGRSQVWKNSAALLSGMFLLLFGIAVVVDTIRRLLTGSEPIGYTMMGVAAFAAAINFLCVRILGKLEHDDVSLRSAETFSANDFISNGGVLIAGALVALTGQRWPDLLVGLLVAGLALKGGLDIVADARRTR